MKVLQSLLLIGCLLGSLVSAQDYQDYQPSAPRAAPHRLHSSAQEETRPTPVPILKQINKHNEDGSYTYGYEGADGSFKIETKLATGEVKGKYGYVDADGKVRVVEYGANKYGFQPSGEGITVAPPTLVDESTKEEPDYEDEPVQRPQRPYRVQRPQQQQQHQPRPQPPRPQPQPQPQPQYVQYEEEEAEPQRRVQYAPQPQPSVGPAPPRLQVPGAQRTTDVLYSPLQRPARPEPDYTQSQSFGEGPSNVRISRPVYALPPASPAPSSARAQGFLAPASGGRPLLEPVHFGPSQGAGAQPVQQPQQQPQRSYQPQAQGRIGGGGGGSLLDQLARDYALPQGNAQPLHDITFGYY
ncbi:pollen-specific leucine-rich repeat extensin-like protein 1 [Drosophila novamexicana]|uniref:pollen-specific leucine-rich repeat extensin-like protein 1 n=1 Tax=Drosophila novamexicana TaxID=47314 RepID=UPI0011E5D26F|nr:pollen-specific leucine-rich repeat extensin-like protein 1 [Drosophila novamexicana]